MTVDFDHPETNGFSEENFNKLIGQTAAIRRLIFFDTCLSGEVEKDEATLASTVTTKSEGLTFRAAGAGLRSNAIGINNANALMRDVYLNLNEGTGSTIISSAGGVEFAVESNEWKNGLFTYCFIKGIKEFKADYNNDKEITISELQEYVRKEVFKMSNGKQLPSFKNENNYLSYRIR